MRFRRRLGVLATAVSGLLAAGLLFSAPAFAWKAEFTRLEASCPPGSDHNVISGSAKLIDTGGEAGQLVVEYSTNGDSGPFVPGTTRTFTQGQTIVDFDFSVPSDEGSITVKATATFEKSDHKPVATGTVDLEKCKGEESTTTTPTTAPPTTAPPTTAPPSTAPPSTGPPSTAPPTTAAPPTAPPSSGGAIGGQTSSSAAAASGRLPFTGANSLPLLIAALVLVAGGGGLLIAGRIRARQAK